MRSFAITARFGSEFSDAIHFFRKIAWEIESDPISIVKYCNNPALHILNHLEKMPCTDRVKIYEALAYGDPGVLLACPGSSLSGFLIDSLGNPEQKKIFNQELQKNICTFLAVTEPGHGSNLSAISTRMTNKKLSGEKWLVSHGATGAIGVVIIKTGDGPLSVRALLLTPECLQQKTQVNRRLLPMIGLRGACLSQMTFNQLDVQPDLLLGNHLSPMQHGMMALIKTFNQMRPCVGALAIGVAQAAIDYVNEINLSKLICDSSIMREMQCNINVARNLLHFAAKKIDDDSLSGSYSSLAKARATQTAESVVSSLCDFIGPQDIFDFPLLFKWYRDVWGFEYMEGVRDIHKINVFNDYRTKLSS